MYSVRILIGLTIALSVSVIFFRLASTAINLPLTNNKGLCMNANSVVKAFDRYVKSLGLAALVLALALVSSCSLSTTIRDKKYIIVLYN